MSNQLQSNPLFIDRLFWEQRVGGSNPLAPTTKRGPAGPRFVVGTKQEIRTSEWDRGDSAVRCRERDRRLLKPDAVRIPTGWVGAPEG